MVLVLGFRGAWLSYSPPRVPKQRRPWDTAFPPCSGSGLAGSPAMRGLPHCPGYGHWVSYCCVARVFGFGFRFTPANPGWGLWCVFFGTGFVFTLPILAGVWDACVWMRVSPSPYHSWLGLLVRVFGFCLHPAIAGWSMECVCSGARSAYTPPLLAGVCGVCVRVRVWAAPANPGWGVGCVCLCAGATCTPPILAGVWSVCVCVRVLPVPRQSWLGLLGHVFAWGCGSHPANPGYDLWCVCSGPGFAFTTNAG